VSILKGRGVGGRRPVYVYDAGKRDKRWVGTIGACSGNGNARTCKCSECKKGRALEAEHAKRPRVAEPALTVEAWARSWLEEMHGPKTTRASETTYRHNKERISAFLTDHGPKRLISVGEDDAQDFALEHPGRVKAVKAMFADARRRRRITVDPFAEVKPPRSTGRQQIIPLTEPEVARLADIARGTGRYGQELGALITFAAWTGLRPGEVCGLEWPEVDLQDDSAESVLHVEWQRRKDGARVRTKTKVNRDVPLCAQALDALVVLPRRPGAVFRSMADRELRPEALGLYWRPVRDAFTMELVPGHWLSRRLRQDPDDKLHLYEVRHHFGSVLGDQGLSARDISKVMGNSPAVCEAVYVHPFQSRVQDRVRAALERAAGNLPESAVGCDDGAQVA
jgi:integrase